MHVCNDHGIPGQFPDLKYCMLAAQPDMLSHMYSSNLASPSKDSTCSARATQRSTGCTSSLACSIAKVSL